MMKFPIAIGLLLFVTILCTGCEDTNDNTNDLTIEIISPLENGKVSDPSKTNIHVKMAATVELHEVEITLTEKNIDSIKIKHFSKYAHSKAFEYQENVDLSAFSSGTEFQLKAVGCGNHECGFSITKIIFFTI